VKVIRLSETHGPALEELLHEDTLVNLFLLGYLDATSIGRAHWYGVLDGERLQGAILVVPNRIAVPWSPHSEVSLHLGAYLRWRHRPCMMVGPRAHCDNIWRAWSHDARIDKWFDQRLYTCKTPVPGPRLEGFRRANPRDWRTVARYANEMEHEDLGRRPREADPDGYDKSVQRRIEQGSTWVLERKGEILFQIHVGTTTPWGVQVGGTYVPPHHRGKGLAKQCMLELGRRLLPSSRCITLHVNEANLPAVKTYEGSGYVVDAPYRLVTLPP
jgi:ribosomal protein S18 acetylase RimI-like enzyme